MEFGADTAIDLALQVGDLGDVVLGVDAVRHHDPVAAEDPGVGALGVGGEHALRPALEAVEFAGDQRLERDLVVLELRNLELEALLGGEVARRHHHEDAGVGFGVDQAVAPHFVLRRGGSRDDTSQCSDKRGVPNFDDSHGAVPPSEAFWQAFSAFDDFNIILMCKSVPKASVRD